jgi:DNA-nicking Smr family endonuclease
MTAPRRPRLPTAEDRALWDTVAKTVAPLKRREGAAVADATPQSPPGETKPTAGPAATAAGTGSSEPPRLAPLDRRLKARIGKGMVAIDARVDLHGLTQAAAHRRLRAFLAESQTAGARLVLVITGKGHPADAQVTGKQRGVLRGLVPIWLASTELRSFVVAYEAAGRSHGGEGALYVRIRSLRRSGGA